MGVGCLDTNPMPTVAGCSTSVGEASSGLSGRCLPRFPCLADREERSSLCFKVIMVLFHLIFGGSLFLLDTELRRRIIEHPWYTAMYVVLFLATLVQYFFTCYSSPGHVIDAIKAGSGKQTTSTDTLVFDPRQTTPRYDFQSSYSQINSLTWMKQVMELYPPGLSSTNCTCSYCNIIQPPRSKHCHDCGKCVLQFDHHCTWIGTCIGKGNHCRFWWYIFEETVLCIWTGTLYINLFISNVTKTWWMDLIAVILLMLLTFCFIISFLLLIFHSVLAITNQTTHEIIRRRRILYLRDVPSKVHPFSRGICGNLFAFCCSCGDTYTLEAVPLMDDLEARAKPFTCIDIISCRCC